MAPLLKLCNDVTGGQRIHKTVTSRCRRFDCACRWLSHPITDLSCFKANKFSLIPLRSAWLASAINNVALESSSNCIECMRTGRSAGGLLIGNVVNWRPDLFQVCLATLYDAGFDCFREHLLNSLTLIHSLSYTLMCSLTRSTYVPCASFQLNPPGGSGWCAVCGPDEHDVRSDDSTDHGGVGGMGQPQRGNLVI